MGHTQLINNMSHNSCIELVNRKAPCPPEEPKRYFHHPYGMAYRINNEWVPCPGYEESSIIPHATKERTRKTVMEEWRPKKLDDLKSPSQQKVDMPSKEALQKLVEKHNMSMREIGRRYHCSATTVHNWFKHYGIETPFSRRKRLKEERA